MCSTCGPSTPAGATFTARLRVPKGSASNPLLVSSSEISAKTACWAGVSSRMSGISRRWLSTPLVARCFDLFKQHALMSDVLIDDPQPLVVHGKDERLAYLP